MIRDDNLLNEKLEGYRITARIGSHAFSSTFLGESISPTTPYQHVIVKLLSTAGAHTLQEQQDILSKISPLQQLDHPHILPILSAGFHKDAPYIITQYLPSGSLYNRLQRRSTGQPIAQEEALLTLAQVGWALHYVHQQKIIHGYLKPQNVLFNTQDEALVTGFHQHALSLPDETEDRQPLELSIYLAPEQLIGQTSAKSDQYTLACLAYALFTGYKVFMVPSVKTPGTYYKTKSLIPPRRLNGALPSYIDEAILKAMAKEPDQRYPDIAAFLIALRISPVIEFRDQRKTGTFPAQIIIGEIPGLPPAVKVVDRQFTKNIHDRARELLPVDIIAEKENNSGPLTPLLPGIDEQFEAITLPDAGLLNIPDQVQGEEKQLPFKFQQLVAGSKEPIINMVWTRLASRPQRTFAIVICLLVVMIILAAMLFAMNLSALPKKAITPPSIRGTATMQSSPSNSRPTPIVIKPGVSSGTTVPPQNTGTTPGQGTVPYPTSAPPSTTGSLGFSQGVNSVSSSRPQFWFAPNGWTAAYVILHYTRTGQTQQNIQMVSSSGGHLWQYTVSGLNSTKTLTYWFTYQHNGTQYDSGKYTWAHP